MTESTATETTGTRGSCLCGDVAFEFHGAPLRMVNCHCPECQRARGAAYATNIFVRGRQFRWTRGQQHVGSYRLPGAASFGTAFCKRCGSDLPRMAREDAMVIPAGALDDDPGIRPSAHVCVSGKASWFEITDELPQYAGVP